MDRPTPSQSSSRLPSSVSTRSMARLASTSSSGTSSSLTRPTLSSSRKATTTLLKRSTTGLGLNRKRLVVLGDDSPKDTSMSSTSSSGSGGGVAGGKRKAGEDGGVAKKVRLYSPEPRRLASTTSRVHTKSTLIPSARPGGPSTPVRTTSHMASSKPGARWVHPLAHTPNKVHVLVSPTAEGGAASEDEMLLGDSPIAKVWPGDMSQKSVRELGPRAGRVKAEPKVREADKVEEKGGWSDRDIEMAMEDMDGSEDVDMAPNEPVSPIRLDPPGVSPPENRINSMFVVSTTPPHPPPSMAVTAPGLHPTSSTTPTRLPFKARTATTSTTSLAAPSVPYTIASSPRKGLSSVSRFGTLKKGPPTSTTLSTLASSSTPVQSSSSQSFSCPTSAAVQPPSALAPAPAPSGEDVNMDAGPSSSSAPAPAPVPQRVPSAPRAGVMLPPSRIPLRAPKPPALLSASSSSNSGAFKRSALGSLGVAAQRPLARSITSTSLSRPSTDTSEPVRRKPSYPSSLGSGPLVRPRDRQISVPVPSHIIEHVHRDVPSANPTSHASLPPGPAREPLRSVSAPGPRANQPPTERQSLSLSTRKEGWLDTSRSLHGLSEALERLKVKKDAPAVEPTRRPSLASSTARSSLASIAAGGQKENILGAAVPSAGVSARLSAVHKPRYSVSGGTSVSGAVLAGVEEAEGDRSLAAIVSSTSGSGCLKGVVAFVDVWTADGTDSSGIFAEMLRSLGARVLSRPSESCTHIIYKSGRPATLNWYRKQKQLDEDEPGMGLLPHIVGLSWVTRSKEAGKRLDEAKFAVEVGNEDVFAKRRKSMEPKSLAALSTSIGPGQIYPASILSGVAEAKRKSLIYAPKVGSPLKKGHKHNGSDD